MKKLCIYLGHGNKNKGDEACHRETPGHDLDHSVYRGLMPQYWARLGMSVGLSHRCDVR